MSSSSLPSADELKELGNKSFASKDYEKAIEYYSKAIKLDIKNHIYYSNRSTCYNAIKEYEKAIDDAKECIKLSPEFIKGYYRLAIPYMEKEEYDKCISVIKQGLQIDSSNIQLTKLLRQVTTKHKASIEISNRLRKEKEQKENNNANNNNAGMIGGNGGLNMSNLDPTVAKELEDLQVQYMNYNKEYQQVQLNIQSYQREYKMNEITKLELNKLFNVKDDDEEKEGEDNENETTDSTDNKENNTSSNNNINNMNINNPPKIYESIGKMFMLSSQKEAYDNINQDMLDNQSKEIDLNKKLQYLDKRIKSTKQNINELIKSHSSQKK